MMAAYKAVQHPAWRRVLRCDGVLVKEFLQHHLQAPLQFAVAVLLCSLLVFVKALSFPLACLAGVYTVVLHLQQARNQHVGTLLLSSSGMLGAVWLGVLTAGVLATITFQARTTTVQFTLLTVLSSVTFAVYGIVKVTPMPVRLALQGSNLMITFGMSVVLSLFAPDVSYLWSTFVGNLALAFTAAALATSLSGIVVLPSLATEAAMSNVATALRKTGQASTICVSILLRPGVSDEAPAGADVVAPGKPVPKWQQQQQPATAEVITPKRKPVSARLRSLLHKQSSSPAAHLPVASFSAENCDVQLVKEFSSSSFRSAQTTPQPSLKSTASTKQGSAITEQPTNAAHVTLDGQNLSTAATEAGTVTGRQAIRQRSAAAAAVQAACSTDTSSKDAAGTAAADNDDDMLVIDLNQQSINGIDLPQLHNTNSGIICEPAAVRSSSGGSSSSSILLKRKHNHLGLNLLKQQSYSSYQQQNQQQQQWAGHAQQQQIPTVQLAHKVAKIRPHLIMARKLQDAVAVEQAWWVRLLVGGVPLIPYLPMDDWQALINALAAFVERVAALEGVLEAGCGKASQLPNCSTLRETCSLIFAQSAALCGSLSIALQANLQQRQQQQRQGLMTKILCCCSSSRSSSSRSDDLRSREQSTGSSRPMFQISWDAARQQLLAKQQSEMQQFASNTTANISINSDDHIIQATSKATSKATGSTIGAVFLCTLGFGVIEAAEKLQAAGQVVLYGRQTAAAADTNTACSESARPAPLSATAAAAGEEDTEERGALALQSAVDLNLQIAAADDDESKHACALRSNSAAAAAAATTFSKGLPAKPNSSSSSSGVGDVVISGTSVLVDSLLCLSLFRRLRGPLLQQLPAALASTPALMALLHKRRCQAGVKLWFVSSAGLAVMVATSQYWPHIPPNIMMVALKAIVFSMKERVEASTEMMIMRVVSTVIGVCFGHLLMFNPLSANQPWGLAAGLLFFALIVPPFASGQYCMLLCLGLISINSTVLCQYVGCCDAAGKLEYFYGRIAATAGGALFSMLVNRLVMPWERDSWAMEEVGQVLGLGVAAAQGMYESQLNCVMERYAGCAAAAAGGGGGGGGGGGSSKLFGGPGDTDRDYVAVPVLTLQQQQQQQANGMQPGIVKPPTAAAATGGSQPYPHKHINGLSPSKKRQQQQQQQQVFDAGGVLAGMKAVLAPVLLAVQRDTWMTWKWGELAVPPVVPKSLSAIQQLSDALAALKVTHDHNQQHLQQQQDSLHKPLATAGAAAAAVAAAESLHSSSGSSDVSNAAGEAPEQCSPLLFAESSLQLLHTGIVSVFQELQCLVQLVQQQVRSPTADRQEALKHKVSQIQQLLGKIRLADVADGPMLQQQQQQQLTGQQLGADQQQQSVQNHHCHQPQQQQQNGQNQQQQQQPPEALPSRLDPFACQVKFVSMQYLSFVFALKYVFNRAVAVAACVADD